jgi:DNA-binding transcriptional ArsR family regulator
MEYIGLDPERLRIAFMTSGEGNIFAEVVTDFSKKVKEIGPLGKSEGIDENELQLKLKAVRDIVPYIKLVERESLRVHFNTEEEYYKYYDSEEADRLFKEFIVDKLAISEIMLLLHEKPLSTGEIAEVLNLNPSEVSRYLNSSARQGLVRFDEDKKRYAPVMV